MRGDIVYRVYTLHEGREKECFFGAFRSRSEADAEIARLSAMEMNGRNWAQQYHNRGFVVRETVVDTDFEIPSCPKPRDKYAIKCSPKPNRPGTWDSTLVEVFRRTSSSGEAEKICEYERNYSMLQTFEPFRQGSREFALISRNYTKTAVLDLGSGSVIAEETDDPDSGAVGGFCPVGFYVPDWWDVNDGSIIPGSDCWDANDEWPNGDFGFVWGCHWGDDTSWKVQYLDLSRVEQGVVRREDRFGYVELATSGFESPCLTLDAEAIRRSEPPHFIHVSTYNGAAQVTFAVEMKFSLDSGRPREWQRLNVANLE
ncbi:MAG: hypothetical protein HUU20_13320 [Pirellulales bacterium]|nr:hypothetical protein [Pirellulales bacterium]